MDDKDRPEVDHPKHYGGKHNPHEVIKCLEAWLTPEEFTGFLKGNCLKYLARAGKKAAAQTDLLKARWYLDYLIEFSQVQEAKKCKSNTQS